MSLSTIVLHYSKSTLLRRHPPLLNAQKINHRRALSYDELVSANKINQNLSVPQPEESMVASGCSLAMDFSRSFDRKHSQSSSSSSTINSDEEEEEGEKEGSKMEKRIKQFKWKLRINK